MTKIQDFVESYNNITDTGKSISLADIVETFNRYYIKYLMDYSRLPMLGLSKTLNFKGYSVDEYNNEKIEIELYGVNNSFYGEENQLLTLYKNSGYSAAVSNIMGDENTPSFREFIAIDEDKIETYIDFGKRYSNFIESYYDIKNNKLFNEYGCRLTSYLGDYRTKNVSHYIHEIESLTLSLSMDRPNGEDTVEFDFYLSHLFGYIIAHKCKFDNESMQLDVKDIEYIINNIYIDSDKLPNLFKQQKRVRKKEVK